MRNFGDKDNIVGIENIFSFENNELKNNNKFEEIKTDENYLDELYSNLE